MTWRGTAGLAQQLRDQADFVRDSSPAYGRLLERLIPEVEGEFGQRLAQVWAQRCFDAAYERALLLQASLRYCALVAGASHPLHAGLVDPGEPEAVSAKAVAAALHDPLLGSLLRERKLQTNETSRAVVWLWPLTLFSRRAPSARWSLFDVGASAGLNLVADALDRPWRDSGGGPLIQGAELANIIERTGFDLCPLDVRSEQDANWLRACVWPGQHARLTRLNAAIAVFVGLPEDRRPELRQGSLAGIPPLLNEAGSHSLAYQSVVRDYVDASEYQQFSEGMAGWLSARPGHRVWLELELIRGGEVPLERSAAVTAHIAADGGVVDIRLAVCHPHPTELSVEVDGVARLTSLLAP